MGSKVSCCFFLKMSLLLHCTLLLRLVRDVISPPGDEGRELDKAIKPVDALGENAIRASNKTGRRKIKSIMHPVGKRRIA